MPKIKKLLILGPGLLGGSLGLAAKRHEIAKEVAIWGRNEESLRFAISIGAADTASLDIANAARDAQIVVFATPTRVFEQLASQVCAYLPKQAVVTDVGSVKLRVCEVMDQKFPGRFIGAHPMAGAEKSGITNARAELFENATCILTPTDKHSDYALSEIENFWSSLGCRVVHMSPNEHDLAVAYFSHLPHLLAAALVNSTLPHAPARWKNIPGPGFRDTTRVASGPPQMWSEILTDNRANLASAIAQFLTALEQISSALRNDDPQPLEKLLRSAKQLREEIFLNNTLS